MASVTQDNVDYYLYFSLLDTDGVHGYFLIWNQ